MTTCPSLELPQPELGLLPLAPPGLDEEALRAWGRMRLGVGRRHRDWRANLPAIDSLFEDDLQRAKALAGNLATELGEVLRRTAQMHPHTVLAGSPAGAWSRDSCAAWLRLLDADSVKQVWGADAAVLYRQILEQLVERGHERALAVAAAQMRNAEGSHGNRISSAVALLVGPLRRFFRPE